jgi:hypothetical protein
MDHPDIIHYLSNLLNSKCLAMFSNTNQLIYSIANSIYLQRSISDHVISMININKYYYRYEYDKVLKYDKYNNYKEYKKHKHYDIFNSNETEISFDYKSIIIKHDKLLTLDDIEHINKIFKLEINPDLLILTHISGCKSNLNYEYIKRKMNEYYKPIHVHKTLHYYEKNYIINLEMDKLFILTTNYETMLTICKQLL